jgi:hypothetical protein
MTLAADGRTLLTTGNDGSTRAWDISTRRLRFTRIALDSSDWVVTTPDGRFDGSQGGIARLHYVRGFETLGLQGYFERFFTPGLIARALVGASQELRADTLPPPPGVRVRDTVIDRDNVARYLIVRTEDRGGGVRAVRLYHNGSALGDPKGGPLCPRGAHCFNATLSPGLNVFEAVAVSRAGVESDPVRHTVIDSMAGPPRVPRLHVLAIGVDDYPAPDQLSKSRNDAADLAFELARRSGPVFSGVTVDTVFNAAATGAGIRAAFARAARMDPDDVFVLVFVGHGIATSDGRFWIAVADVASASDTAAVRRAGLNDDTLRALLAAVPARQKVVILDACHAGLAVERSGLAARPLSTRTRGGSGGPNPPRVQAAEATTRRALSQLGHSGGMFIIGSTSSDQVAFEGDPNTRNGVFATAVLSALDGGADDSRPRTVRALLAEVEARLPALSRKLGVGTQYPVVWSMGRDFPLVGR